MRQEKLRINLRNSFVKVKTAKKRSKSSANWLRRQLNDPYVKMANNMGYRSRAAFKIIEIEEKFHLLKQGKIVLDLGSAPGGWSQIAVKKVGNGKVLAVDILEMEPIPGVKFIQQDFLAPEAKKIIFAALSEHLKQDHKKITKCDIILSDIATNSCGDTKTDHLRIVAVLEEILDFSFQVMAVGGSFVGKIFQGGASGELLKKFKQHFTVVKHFKPDSSRKESTENYIVATGFKGSTRNAE